METEPAADEGVHVRCMQVLITMCAQCGMCLLIGKDDQDVGLRRHGRDFREWQEQVSIEEASTI